jgi:hypothetical protein
LFFALVMQRLKILSCVLRHPRGILKTFIQQLRKFNLALLLALVNCIGNNTKQVLIRAAAVLRFLGRLVLQLCGGLGFEPSISQRFRLVAFWHLVYIYGRGDQCR